MTNRKTFLRALLALTATPALANPVRQQATPAGSRKHLLIFGDSNTWGWVPVASAFPAPRYPRSVRWPDKVAANLGPGVEVTVDALSGRTTDIGYREKLGAVDGALFNGARELPAAIAKAMPLDLVVIMLGTNDLRADLDRTPQRIAEGMLALVEAARSSQGGVFSPYPAPQVLMVIPPPLGDTSRTPIKDIMTPDSVGKSKLLASAVEKALPEGVAWFDAGTVTSTDGIDGVHLTAGNHRAVATALTLRIRKLLGS